MQRLSELRQDIVSGDWIVIAASRKGRPHQFARNGKRERASLRGCPFEHPQGNGHGAEPILQYTKGKDWSLQVVENKYPAFMHRDVCSERFMRGIYLVAEGVGHHDLVITRDHHADFPDLSSAGARAVLEAFRERYLMLLHDKCLAYISFFHNWGPSAGASIYHPHYQIIAIPVIPTDVKHSYYGSRRYYREHRRCVHCTMIAYERKEKKRIIFENESAIAFAPFASRSSFEFRVFPKRHTAFFENARDAEIGAVAEALRVSLRGMRRALRDPDYNFFLHTAPLQKKDAHENYHWHIEVLPKTNVFAGFELGTGIEINPIDPDLAAKALRGK